MSPVLSWAYNSNTGAVGPFPTITLEGLLRLGIGWHGPFDTKQDALNYYERNKAANPGWKAPTTDVGTSISNAQDTAKQRGQSLINDATSAWTAAINTIVKLVPRVLEAAVGIVLLAVAANAILKQTTGVDIAGAAVRGTRRAVRVTPAGAVMR